MPIKPENRHRYPADWKVIRAAILRRAGHRCENPECRVGNGWIGYRRDDGYFVRLASDGEGKPDDYAGHATGWRVFRIVLTIAHLNHQPEDCRPENLRALCQRCHLRYDAERHQRNAAATRRAGKAAGDLFAASEIPTAVPPADGDSQAAGGP